MRKRYITILSMLIFIFCISSVTAGFFDIFGSNDSDNGPSFVDMGIKENKSSEWYFQKGLKVTVTDKGTVLINNGSKEVYYSANIPSTSKDTAQDIFEWNAPYSVEFDLISGNDSGLQISDGSKCASRTFEQLGIISNSHIKLVNNGTSVNYYVNGVNDPAYTYNAHPLNHTAIRFVIPPNSNLTYKNFTIQQN